MVLATLGVVSIGEMGFGISKLLLANKYGILTNTSGRSHVTQDRAKAIGIDVVSSDVEIYDNADYILSIVPPREAVATARRFIDASRSGAVHASSNLKYYLDLNAISPRMAREINELFAGNETFHYIDGGIIGGPPVLEADGTWSRPSIPVSGPHRLSEAHPHGKHLAEILNVTHLNSTIGSATGLKMCYASLSKGFTALAIQSFTTAESLGVADEIRAHLDDDVRNRAARGLVSMQSKAYRWVHEMEQIAETFEADGGFTQEEGVFRAVARVYEFVASEELGQRGKGKENAGGVAKALLQGTERRKVKTE